MGGQRSSIFLGDLVQAIRRLEASDYETQKLIAEMLGMNLAPRLVKTPETLVPKRTRTQPLPEVKLDVPPVPATSPVSDSVPITIEHFQSEKGEWISDVEPLPMLQAENEHYLAPQLEPLLLPQWTRGILVGSLATRTDDGLPDIEKITETLARGEAVKELPTHSSPTLRRGLQLLIDKGQAMTLFARDQVWLHKEIRQMAGSDRVQSQYFVGSPLRGAGSGPKPWPEYSPPLPGTPIVLLTDLGICQPMFADDWADTEEWLTFCATIRHADCPLIAFVPYGAPRWPKQLARALTIIQWDRGTTAATVRGLVRDGLETRPT
jgi:hypothetical protein